MVDWSDLLNRVWCATGPHSVLDARIAVAFGDVIMRERAGSYSFFWPPYEPGEWAFLSNCNNGVDEAYRSLGQCLSLQRYTESLDACLSLTERVLPNAPQSTRVLLKRAMHHQGGSPAWQPLTYRRRLPLAFLYALTKLMLARNAKAVRD